MDASAYPQNTHQPQRADHRTDGSVHHAKKIRVGINGFGRIGRCVAKLLAHQPRFSLVAINDIDPDFQNLVYLYNYDSNYGRAPEKASLQTESGKSFLNVKEEKAQFFCQSRIDEVAWKECGADIVIDSSGVAQNLISSRKMIESKQVQKVIVTHSPKENIDKIIIMGLNHADYDASRHHIVSSSICDSNAIGHVLSDLDRKFGLNKAMVTTLHPWLSYQNLVDAPLRSQANPGHFWKDYSLGRASTGALIPKNTTAASALIQACPQFKGRVEAFSYRIPTGVVTSADMTLIFDKSLTTKELKDFLQETYRNSSFVGLNQESLVSVDYEMIPYSCVIDQQWTEVYDQRYAKIILWYDNEWGYSARVADLAAHMLNS